MNKLLPTQSSYSAIPLFWVQLTLEFSSLYFYLTSPAIGKDKRNTFEGEKLNMIKLII